MTLPQASREAGNRLCRESAVQGIANRCFETGALKNTTRLRQSHATAIAKANAIANATANATANAMAKATANDQDFRSTLGANIIDISY